MTTPTLERSKPYTLRGIAASFFRDRTRREWGVLMVSRAGQWGVTLTITRHPYLWTRHRDTNWPDKHRREMTMTHVKCLYWLAVIHTRPTGRRMGVETLQAWRRWWRKEGRA